MDRKASHDLRSMTAAILGMAFKGDSDDPRDSLAFKLRKLLTIECRRVLCTDVYLDRPDFVPLDRPRFAKPISFSSAPATRNIGIWPSTNRSSIHSIFSGAHNMRILVTGAAGFIGGYLVEELLCEAMRSSAWTTSRSMAKSVMQVESNPRYRLVRGDAKDIRLLKELLADCDHMVAGAAMIGGISYFHELAYDLLAENERITAATFDAALGPP